MKIGLVFSGGGSRGAYQIGVWKALEELNIKCQIVTGTSIGSINAALYTQDDLELAENLWKEINFNTVFNTKNEPQNNKDLYKKYLTSIKNGGLDPINLENNLKKVLNFEKFYNSNINYGLVTVKYPRLKEIQLEKKKIKKDKLVDYIIASATVFPFFKIKQIDNNKYVDGGIKNAVPIDLAKKLGAEKLIIVNISLIAKNLKIKKDKNTIIIKPQNKLGFPLKFDNKTAKKNIKYGYNDTMKAFKKLHGKKYTFKDLKSNYQKNELFPTFNSYISIIEYLGKQFNIDDSKIYTQKKFNELLFEKMSHSNIDMKKKIKDRINPTERIVHLYNLFIENPKTKKAKKIFKREYKAAYYLYQNK